jgi:hypothetical protein
LGDCADLGAVRAGLAESWAAGIPVGVRSTLADGVQDAGSGTPFCVGAEAADAVAGTAATSATAEVTVIMRSTQCRNEFRRMER